MSEKVILFGSFLDLSVFIRVKKRIIEKINTEIVMDKVRLHREMLKRTWFSFPSDENKVEIKEIVVDSLSESWHIVKIITDVKSYYSSSTHGFYTLSEAIEYAEKINKENNGQIDYTKYKLEIK